MLAICYSINQSINETKIAIAEAEYHHDRNAAFADALLDSTKEVLDLRNFKLDSMSLKIDKLDVCRSKIINDYCISLNREPLFVIT